ncbi:uncharacterized protein LOC133525166 [Cydia pomonella]|uniref:uncharacterized protein LOC133525166 n=1 Tax=Cydia pomonella TaxID=82600 RepID=UPI002ADE372C|nr:uncharacterized protein LOC133525166 [Cydia pomonella]
MRRLTVNIIISCGLLIGIRGQQMLGAGKWTVLSTQQCANDAEMPWTLHVRRHKLNRTHDAFDADIDLEDDLDDSCAIRLDICKVVDGGCKPYMIMADDCLPNFIKKHAKENVEKVLVSGGVDPPDFPIKKGSFHLKDYVISMEEMEKEGVYGTFEVEAFIIKDGQDVACIKITVKYEPRDDYGSMG